MFNHIARRMGTAPHGEGGEPLVANWFEFMPPLMDHGEYVEHAALDSRGFFACDGMGNITDGMHRLFPRRGITVADALHGIDPAYEEVS